jgi:magnesium-transporting ATPase (P-type)
VVDVKNVAAKISFTFQSLFNAVIRDMNPENKNSENSSANFALFIKGAPEKILPRCTKILSDGVAVKINTDIRVKTIS